MGGDTTAESSPDFLNILAIPAKKKGQIKGEGLTAGG